MSVQTIDLRDDAQLREAHGVTLADASAQAYGVPWTWLEYQVAARTPDPWSTLCTLLARTDDGVPVAVAEAWMPQRDNTSMIWCDLSIVPGYESDRAVEEILGALATLAYENDRDDLQATAAWPVDAETNAKREALERAGFGYVMTNAHRVLDLPADLDRMRSLADEAAPHHAAYRLLSWRGACPEQWMDGYARLRARILVDAPDGGIGYEPEDFGPDRVRHEESEFEAQWRVMYTTIAVHDDGTVAGHSQIVVPGTDEVNAFQWDTLVLAEHRGHRLGLALKARNLSEVADALGSRTVLHTWNAGENAPMVSVNARLGYRLVDYHGEFRLRL